MKTLSSGSGRFRNARCQEFVEVVHMVHCAFLVTIRKNELGWKATTMALVCQISIGGHRCYFLTAGRISCGRYTG